MDLLTICLICVSALFIVFIFALIMGQARMRKIEAVMRQLASKLAEKRQAASFTPGTLIYNPYITFREQGLELRMYAALGGRSDPSHTELRASLNDPAATLRLDAARINLRPHSFLTRLTVTFGAKLYLTGEKAFDEAFDLRGAPDALLQRTFTSQVRQQLIALKVDRPAVRFGRQRTFNITAFKRSNVQRSTLHYYFYTAGLPAELAEWEPRIEVGRLILNNILNVQR